MICPFYYKLEIRVTAQKNDVNANIKYNVPNVI